MKNNYIFGILAGIVLVCLILALWYTFSAKTTLVPEPDQTEIAKDATVAEHGEYYDIRAVYPSKTPLEGSGDVKAINAMRAFIENQIITFKADSNLDNLTTEDIAVQELGGDRKYELEISYKMYKSSNTVSYVYLIYANTLGAHPNAYYRTFTFDVSGNELAISNLFTSEEYLQTLTAISRAELTKTLGDSEYMTGGTEPKEENFQSFYIEGDSLTIVFPPYQVGPWAVGTQSVTIAKSELAKILKAEYK